MIRSTKLAKSFSAIGLIWKQQVVVHNSSRKIDETSHGSTLEKDIKTFDVLSVSHYLICGEPRVGATT